MARGASRRSGGIFAAELSARLCSSRVICERLVGPVRRRRGGSQAASRDISLLVGPPRGEQSYVVALPKSFVVVVVFPLLLRWWCLALGISSFCSTLGGVRNNKKEAILNSAERVGYLRSKCPWRTVFSYLRSPLSLASAPRNCVVSASGDGKGSGEALTDASAMK
jgi:hypothetical protein